MNTNTTNTTDKIANLTYGVELEYEGITQRKAVEAVMAATGGRTDWVRESHLNAYTVTMPDGRKWKVETDGSLRNGCETVSPICTYADIEMIQKVVRALREAGAKAKSTCGLHIHVGAADMTAKQIQNLVKVWYKQENLIVKGCGVQQNRLGWYTRQTDRTFLDKMLEQKNPTMDSLAEAYYHGAYDRDSHYCHSRYRTLNLHNLWNGNKHTVEFRLFEATNHAGEVRTDILLALTVVAFARNAKAASAKQRTFRENSAKYDLRIFLLRLGWIGDEFKNPRKHMMRHLAGSTAWRDGVAHGRSIAVGQAW